MSLANELRALQDRVLTDLNAAHDYFHDSRFAWRLVDERIAAGGTFSIHNVTTGTMTTETNLAGKIRGYVTVQLAEATFQQFLAIFEHFFFDFLRLWLLAYPRSLIGKKVDFQAILEAPDKEAITLHVVNRELNEVLYERPAGWFAYLEDKVKLGCPSADEIDRIAEAKATRDLLAHNSGLVNKAYESKAGKRARFKAGERIEVPEAYHRQVWELLCKVVRDVASAAVTKAP